MRFFFFLLAVLSFTFPGYAQDNEPIKPGVLYKSGSMVQAPRYGVSITIPEGWSAMLPMETEIFMLSREDNSAAQALMFAQTDTTLMTLTEKWEKGTALNDQIYLKAAEKVKQKDNLIFTEVLAEGDQINRSSRGMVIAKCSEFGPCLTLFLITPESEFMERQREAIDLMLDLKFETPDARSPYERFDWQNFLVNKMMVRHDALQGAGRQDVLHFCADGTFTSNIKQTGWMKHTNDTYKGKNKGEWSVTGTGPNAVLNLSFNKSKVPDIQVELKFEEEKLYANGERYYAGTSDHCE